MSGTKINLETLPAEERAAIEARRAYQREWRLKNKDKVKENNRRFWLKKAGEMNNDTTKAKK